MENVLYSVLVIAHKEIFNISPILNRSFKRDCPRPVGLVHKWNFLHKSAFYPKLRLNFIIS